MYARMALCRKFEERAGQAYGQRKIQGFCHLYIGQEAVVVGIEEALERTDAVLTGYRDHVHPIMRGADPGMIMAELFGRDTGYSKGKGGSMHMFDVEHHFFGGYGIVAGQIPLGAGMAFAMKYRGDKSIVVCSFGEGASNQGVVWEVFNMASKWKLPVLFVEENNKYGMGTDIARVSAEPDIAKRMGAFRMRSASVDGTDVLKVYEVTKDLVAHVRGGDGPALLEAYCYRFRGHSMSDAATYRTKDEVEKERLRDPLVVLETFMLQQRATTKEELEAIAEAQEVVVKDALAFADASAEPPLEDLHRHTIIEPGEGDEHPRERVRGVKVDWPTYPTQFRVNWDLEPRASNSGVPHAAAVKGAA